MKKSLFIVSLFVLICINNFANTNPVVTNVSHSYSGGTITVTYDVADSEQSSVTISMFVSDDGGSTWDYACTEVTGHVGSSVSTGTGKTITWTHDNEHGSPPNGSNFIVKILANDETADGDTCDEIPRVEYEGGPNNDGGNEYYLTIQIGDQCWLKENLNVGTMINSTSGGSDFNGEQTNNSTVEKYCYNNNTSNECDTFGGLYQWAEAVAYQGGASNSDHANLTGYVQGICPTGWHIPSETELETLNSFVGSSSNALKAESSSGTNTSGFSALLVGYRNDDGSFSEFGNYVFFWSSTDPSGSNARNMYMVSNTDIFNFNNGYKYEGYSVRCLKY